MPTDSRLDARISVDAAQPFHRSRRLHRVGWQCLLALLSLLWGIGLVHAATYYYDSNGRLTVVTRADGTSARYVYDDLGNIQQIAAIPTGQLAIFGMTPDHGPIGTTVTITGQGFSTTAANDSITFNGTAATAVSATANTLVATVPVGATTGPIAVTVGTNTAISVEPFVIDANGLPPTITSVTPSIVDSGTTVTIAGQYLDPVPGQTNVTLDGQAIATKSVTNTAISFVLPSSAGSGRVTVQTPFGVAASTTDLIVGTFWANASSIGATGRIQTGSSQVLNIPPGQNGVLLFDAANTPADTWLSFQLSALSGITSLNYYIYDPRNNQVASGSLSTTSPSLHLPQLLLAGTYSFVFVPNSSSSISLTIGLEVDPQLALNASAATPAVTAIANQTKRYWFQGSPGTALVFPTVSTTPTGSTVSVTLEDAYGQNPIYSLPSSSAFALNMPFLVTGIYQAIVTPATGGTENTSVLYQSQPGATLTIDGPTVSTTASPVVNGLYSFTAAAGDNLELALSGLTAFNITVSVYDPANNEVGSTSCSSGSPAGSCSLSLTAAVAGSYSIVVTNTDEQAGLMGYQITLTRDITGTLVSGESQTFNLTRPGQSLRLSFNGTAGDSVAVGLSNLTTIPAGNNVDLSVLKPDGTTWISDSESGTGGGAVNLPNLPETGTYTVLVNPNYGLPASMQVVLAPNPASALVANGPSQSVSTFAGENAYVAFTAAAGDNLELGLSGLTLNGGADDCVDVNVYDANNNYVSSTSWDTFSPGSSAHLSLWNLAGGAYSITLAPCAPGDAFSGTLTLTSDVTGTLTTGNPVLIQLASPGQVERLNFVGTTGQTLAVALDNPVTTPSGNSILLTVLNPDGTQYASTDVSSASAVNMPNLAQTGTYTVIVSPDYGLPASLQLTLSPNPPGALAASGPSQSVSTFAGENAYVAFTAAAGDNLELGLSGLTLNGEGYDCVNVSVYDANNSYVSGTSWNTFNPGGYANLSLWNLAGGAYSITLAPCSPGENFSGALTLTSDLTGSLSAGTPLTINLTQPGQTARLSFSGTTGQTATVSFSNVTTTPSGQNLDYWVLNPDGSQYTSGTVYNNQLSLQDLPTTGTYTLILNGYCGVPASMTVSLQ